MARAECFIKGEENNAEKEARDTKERMSGNSDKKNYYSPANRDRENLKRPYGREREYRAQGEFTPLKVRPKKIFKDVYHTKLIPDPRPPQNDFMGHKRDTWYIHLSQEIEKLIQSGKLRGYAKEGYGRERRRQEDMEQNKKDEDPKERHTLNTISGGFAGGGESSTSRKKYVRQIMLLDDNAHRPLKQEPDITFTARDYQGVIPHDDDPMIITLQIFNWNVKRVLIDPGSSDDILYYEAFEKMGINR
jgi:hypothetical protein